VTVSELNDLGTVIVLVSLLVRISQLEKLVDALARRNEP
jgi:hypothetical protein